MSVNFYDYCKANSWKKILDSYEGEIDLRTYGIGSHKEISLRCNVCNKIFKRQVRLIVKSGIDRAYCRECSKTSIKTRNKEPRTLYDWLEVEGKSKYIELAKESDLERAKSLSINAREEIEFRCLIHNIIEKKQIYSFCKSQYSKLSCCKEVKFTFQDWCLSCYNTLFKIFIEDYKYKKSKYKAFTGEKVKEYYFNAVNLNNTVNSNYSAQQLYEQEDFGSKQEFYLECEDSKNNFNPERIALYRITRSRAWCKASCSGCDYKGSKIEKGFSLEEFLSVYGIGGESNAEIIKLESEIEKLEKGFSSGTLFSQKSQEELEAKKAELEERRSDFFTVSSKILREINIGRKRYTKRIIQVLEAKHYIKRKV